MAFCSFLFSERNYLNKVNKLSNNNSLVLDKVFLLLLKLIDSSWKFLLVLIIVSETVKLSCVLLHPLVRLWYPFWSNQTSDVKFFSYVVFIIPGIKTHLGVPLFLLVTIVFLVLVCVFLSSTYPYHVSCFPGFDQRCSFLTRLCLAL